MMGMGKALEASVRKVRNLADSSALNKVFCMKEQFTICNLKHGINKDSNIDPCSKSKLI